MKNDISTQETKKPTNADEEMRERMDNAIAYLEKDLGISEWFLLFGTIMCVLVLWLLSAILFTDEAVSVLYIIIVVILLPLSILLIIVGGYGIKTDIKLKKQLYDQNVVVLCEIESRIAISKKNQEQAEQRKQEERRRKASKYALAHPECPMCKSTNTGRISDLNRAVSVGTLGLASSKIGKTFECYNCKYKW